MCGIVACASKNNCSRILFNGLLQLKNRGYDSVGMCSANEYKFTIDKFASTPEIDSYELLNRALENHSNSKIGIAHTRWATHGAKTDENSHPHISMCGKFSIVHNGIIENYKDLKQMLASNGYVFKSQTDSEVIVQLLSYVHSNSKNENIMDSIKEMLKMLQGTWGLVIVCLDKPDSIYCTRHGSPVLIGYDDECAIVCSEKSGFCNRIQNYFVLGDLEICKIKLVDNCVKISMEKDYKLNTLRHEEFALSPEPYLHWTIKEIYEQPESALRAISMGGRLMDDGQVKLGGLDDNFDKLKNIDNLILLGCGTSYFAGQHSLFFFKDLCDFNSVQLFDGADFKENDVPKNGKSALILISQSGETKDLHRCIDIGKRLGLFLIGLVNVVDSLIAREVNCGCYLNAGKENGVASTKSYTSQVIILSMIAVWFSQKKRIHQEKREKYIRDIRKLHYDITNALTINEDLLENVINKVLIDKEHLFLLGKGKSESIAKEGALKIKEITYIHAEGYSTSSLKHGPFALLDEKFPVILISPNDEHYKKNENAYEEIKSRNSPIIFITDDLTCDKLNVLYVPKNDTFCDLLSVIPLQLIAYRLAVLKGINPDTPKNLAKVVTVE